MGAIFCSARKFTVSRAAIFMASFKSSSESHENPVRGGLRARPINVKILPHHGLDFDLLIGTFQGGQVHFAVPLQAVRISRPDQAALLKHREIERRARL